MEGISAGISQILILAIVVVLGFILSKLSYLDEHTSNKLVGILVNVTLPCMIIASTSSVDFQQISAQIPIVCGLGVLLFVAMALISIAACLCLRVSAHTFSCFIFSGICTQTAFIGVPVIAAVLGENTIILTSLIVAVINVFLFSFGVAMLAVDQQLREFREAKTTQNESESFSFVNAFSRVKLTRRNFVNPALVAALAALALLFFQIPMPYVLGSAFDMVGSLTAPISMLVIGFYVSRMKIKEACSQWRVFVFGFIRFFLGSLALFYLLSFFISDELVVAIAVLEFANGALGTLEASTTCFPGYPRRLEICGDKGSAVLSEDTVERWDLSIPLQLETGTAVGGAASDPKAISCEGHRRQLENLVGAIEGREALMVDAAEGRKPLEIILAVYQSAREGRRVALIP